MAFDLQSITKGKRLRAPKIVVYGPPKIGKSTLAASAPNPIGIITEEGLDNIDVAAFPKAERFEDVIAAIGTLYTEPHEYQTVFVDSLDWLEPLILKKVCADNGVDNIEKIGFGKGYIFADDLWKQFFDGLDALRNKGMTIICIAHEHMTKVKDPSQANDYDAYSLKLNKRATALVNEWADVIGFCQHEVYTRQVDPTNKLRKDEVKATGTGQRKLHLNPSPAYVAGNRYGIKDCLLSWTAFQAAMTEAMNAPSLTT